jgi:D-tyrosyl-tRNA(Tyr) deacylase
MRAVVQRVRQGRVEVGGQVVGQIGRGLAVLVGVAQHDTQDDARWLAEKIAGLRIFPDQQGQMNLDVRQIGGQILSVSQFTLYGDVRRGRRPSFGLAASPGLAEGLWEHFNDELRRELGPVETGRFRADMDLHLLNWGPVTLVIDTPRRGEP